MTVRFPYGSKVTHGEGRIVISSSSFDFVRSGITDVQEAVTSLLRETKKRELVLDPMVWH